MYIVATAVAPGDALPCAEPVPEDSVKIEFELCVDASPEFLASVWLCLFRHLSDYVDAETAAAVETARAAVIAYCRHRVVFVTDLNGEND